MPRAPSRARGVTSHAVAACATSAGVTPPSLLLQAHAPVLHPPTAYGHSLGQRVFTGRCQPRLGIAPSQRYLHESFPRCLDPYPGGPCGARTRFFPQGIGLPHFLTGSALHKVPYNDVSTGVGVEAAAIHSCSGLRVCSPPRSFPPQRSLRVKRLRRGCRVRRLTQHFRTGPQSDSHGNDPSPVPCTGRPWLLRPRLSRSVTSPSSGYASRPNRAIDGGGTCTLQDSRPCWPLLGIPTVSRVAGGLKARCRVGRRELGKRWGDVLGGSLVWGIAMTGGSALRFRGSQVKLGSRACGRARQTAKKLRWFTSLSTQRRGSPGSA